MSCLRSRQFSQPICPATSGPGSVARSGSEVAPWFIMPCGCHAVKSAVSHWSPARLDPDRIVPLIRRWGAELGFQQLTITDADPGEHRRHLRAWLAAGYHGEKIGRASCRERV